MLHGSAAGLRLGQPAPQRGRYYVVNSIQWTDNERLKAAHHSPDSAKVAAFGELVQDVEPALADRGMRVEARVLLALGAGPSR